MNVGRNVLVEGEEKLNVLYAAIPTSSANTLNIPRIMNETGTENPVLSMYKKALNLQDDASDTSSSYSLSSSSTPRSSSEISEPFSNFTYSTSNPSSQNPSSRQTNDKLFGLLELQRPLSSLASQDCAELRNNPSFFATQNNVFNQAEPTTWSSKTSTLQPKEAAASSYYPANSLLKSTPKTDANMGESEYIEQTSSSTFEKNLTNDPIEGKDIPSLTVHHEAARLMPATPMSIKGTFEVDLKSKYGTGAWSFVYPGVLHDETAGNENTHQSLVVAVKQPLNKMSTQTLRREALVLTYIYDKIDTLQEKHIPSIVPFHGFDPLSSSILMTACPGEQLNGFITRHAQYSKFNTSSQTLKLPAVGVRQWIFLCERLISAMTFLKVHGIVHGDIKPHNILLRSWKDEDNRAWWSAINLEERETVLVEPLLSDFSSSFLLRSDGSLADIEESVSAGTTTYTAPEILQALLTPPVTPKKQSIYKTNTAQKSSTASTFLIPETVTTTTTSNAHPTFASDLYSLALTILQAGIGSHPYSNATSGVQRNMWVRQGDPLSFARADERALKCMKGGVVARLVKGCFGKTSTGRTTIEEMMERVKNMGSEWRTHQAEGDNQWIWKAIP